MAFVYKYCTADDKVAYVGKVSGDDFDCLSRRIKQHEGDIGSRQKYRVYYAETKTPADADTLETILIAYYKPYMNKAKTRWGYTSYGDLVADIAWQAFDADYVHRLIERKSFSWPRTFEDICVCDRCGELTPRMDACRISFSALCDSFFHFECTGYICIACASETEYDEIQDCFSLTSNIFEWRNRRSPDVELWIDMAEDRECPSEV